MHEKLNKPKKFGEVLDTTFTLSRDHFMDFLKIFLLIVGPVILLEAIIGLGSGESLIRGAEAGEGWIERSVNSFIEDGEIAANTEGSFWTLFVNLLMALFTVLAQVAIVYAINAIRQGNQYSISGVVKRAFSRFWPLFFAGFLLFLFISFGAFILLLLAVLIIALLSSISGILAVLLGSVIIFGLIILGIYLFVRLYFYSAAIAFGDTVLASFETSWKLTKGRFWFLIGIAFVFALIIGTVNTVFEIVFGFILGNSVLYGLIISSVLLVTTMITAVAFAVVYFDLYVRHDSTDLREMIDKYDQT